MIAQRFRPVAWVLGVACAATLLYSVSLRVANERSRLDALEEKIALTKRDIRRLQTELGARGSLRQLEKWNGEALALAAPTAKQFMASERQLAKVDASGVGAKGYIPAPVMISTQRATEPAAGSTAQDSSMQERVAMLDKALTVTQPKDGEQKADANPTKTGERAIP